jgi:hypothetical protein
MKKLIIMFIAMVLCIAKVSAFDLIIMKNGDSYFGTIITMDINDKVVIQTQEGKTEILTYRDISSLKKIDTESVNPQTSNTPQIIIQNTNSNVNAANNIIGKTVSMQDNPNFIQYIPATKGGIFNMGYEPPRAVFKGMRYNVETYAHWPSDIKDFLSVIRGSVQNLDYSIEEAIRTIEHKIQSKQNTFTAGAIIGGGGLIVAWIPLLDDDFPEKGMGLYIGGMVSAVVGEIIMLTQFKNCENEVRNLIALYNQRYAQF